MDPMCSLHPWCFLSNGNRQLATAHAVSATVMIGVKSSDSIRKDEWNKEGRGSRTNESLGF